MALAVSMGEPAGIGPDIILLAFLALKDQPEALRLVVFGDAALFQSRARRLGLTVEVYAAHDDTDALNSPSDSLPVVSAGETLDMARQARSRLWCSDA